jgi:hypothetical protein
VAPEGNGESDAPAPAGAVALALWALGAAGFVGEGGPSRGLSGNSDHNLVGLDLGAFDPLSARASEGLVACRPHARTRARRTDLTMVPLNGSSPECQQASVGPV